MTSTENTAESDVRPRYVTSPHGRPKCPEHGVRLVVRTSAGEVAYLRCPVDGCCHQDKMTREVLREGD